MANSIIRLTVFMSLVLPIAADAEQPSKADGRDAPNAENRPHGRVTWTLHKQKLAWIDLGIVDGVNVGSRFAVYAAGERHPDRIAKGELKVVRLLDKHLAEARITLEAPNRAILPSDLIVSLQPLVPRKFVPPAPLPPLLLAGGQVQDSTPKSGSQGRCHPSRTTS